MSHEMGSRYEKNPLTPTKPKNPGCPLPWGDLYNTMGAIPYWRLEVRTADPAQIFSENALSANPDYKGRFIR